MASAQAGGSPLLLRPQRIIKKMKVGNSVRYLTKYQGLCDDYNQWVEEAKLQNFNALIKAFDSRHSFPEENSTLKCREIYFNKSDEGFAVEKIVGKRRCKGGRLQYKCQYKGYSESRNNWEYFTDLYDCLDVVKKYEDGKLSPEEAPSGLFEQGWEVVTVLGAVDRDTCVDCDKAYYLVGLRNPRTKEFMKKVLSPEACGRSQRKVKELVRKFEEDKSNEK